VICHIRFFGNFTNSTFNFEELKLIGLKQICSGNNVYFKNSKKHQMNQAKMNINK